MPVSVQHAPWPATFYTMDKRDEPPEWLRQAAQNVDALITSSWQIIRAAQEYLDQARAAQKKAGPILASGAEVALALDAGMAELVAAVRRQAAPRHHTRSAHLTVTPTVFAMAGVATATGTAMDAVTVVKQDEAGRTLVPANVIVALAPWLLLLIAFALSLGETRLSSEQRQFLSDYITNFALALAVAWRIRDNGKG
jgi:hypothetical protein